MKTRLTTAMQRHALVALLLAACGRADAPAGRWDGVVDTLPDGVVRITNNAPTWGPDDAWRLDPLFDLGSVDGGGPAAFSSISDIETDGDGNLYVLDRQLNELRVFDRAGGHVRTVGREGRGPGEFINAFGLVWLPGEDSLLVADGSGGRYSIFDRAGNFARTLRRPITSRGWVMSGGFAKGLLYEQGLRPVDDDYTNVLIGMRLGDEAILTDTIDLPRADAPVRIFEVRTKNAGMSMTVPFAPGMVWALAPDGSIWWGEGGEYRIRRVSPDGATLLEIAATAEPVPVTSEEISAWEAGPGVQRFRQLGGKLDLDRIPKVKPFFTALYADPEGHVWVEVPSADGNTAYDVFDERGRLLGRIATGVRRVPGVDPVVRDGRLVLAGTDALDVPHLFVFRILRPEAG